MRSSSPSVAPSVVGGPVGLPVAAAADYRGAVRRSLIAHKDRGQLALATPLGWLLAQALVRLDPGSPLILVPCPSAATATRRRGQDHVRRLASSAQRQLARRGAQVAVKPVVRATRPVLDQVGMTATQRSENVAGAFVVRSPRTTVTNVMIVDDIVTTGATIGEVHRALSEAGWVVRGAAVVARTSARTGVASSASAGLV